MIHPFKSFPTLTQYFLIRSIVRRSVWSESDECMVASMNCGRCSKRYDEELQEARKKVLMGEEFKCLSCDDKGGRIRDIRAVQFTFEIV